MKIKQGDQFAYINAGDKLNCEVVAVCKPGLFYKTYNVFVYKDEPIDGTVMNHLEKKWFKDNKKFIAWGDAQ